MASRKKKSDLRSQFDFSSGTVVLGTQPGIAIGPKAAFQPAQVDRMGGMDSSVASKIAGLASTPPPAPAQSAAQQPEPGPAPLAPPAQTETSIPLAAASKSLGGMAEPAAAPTRKPVASVRRRVGGLRMPTFRRGGS